MLNNKWVVKPIVPEEIYTDREEFLDYFYRAALDASRRRTMSTVLLGQRRMGKTEIFKRVVNRLYFEQDPKKSEAVVPVYYSFPDSKMDAREFGKEYVENFLKYYVGFYTRDYKLIRRRLTGEKLMAIAKEAAPAMPSAEILDWIIQTHESIDNGNSTLPHRDALEVPRQISDSEDSTIVMFLDEFQNTRLPLNGFDIVGFMQNAVESPTCPHFVTGSAMSILAKEIIGRGSLFGRFRGKDIKAMTGYYGAELARKAAGRAGLEIPEVMAPIIAERCGGNPFYINAVVQQAAELRTPVLDEESLNKILAVDLSSGFIWGELNDQVTRWFNRINKYGITKWVLYLSALDENTEPEKRGRLNVERIQRELKKRKGKEVSLDVIRDVLILLSRGDLLEYLELGGWFRRLKDPILVEFLKVWGKIEVEGHSADSVRDELVESYDGLERKFREYKGYLAEVHMSQALLNARRKILPGSFFNVEEDIRMPMEFFYIEHRMRLGSGKGREIDVFGAAGSEKWVCQSKWLEKDKVGVGVLRELIAQADDVKRGKPSRLIRMWVFANNGLTGPAKKLAGKHGILWSSRKEFDQLLVHLGLRTLPDL